VQKRNFRILMAAVLSSVVAFIAACGGGSGLTSGGADPNETAATVNGKAIKMEEVERAVKQQARGQEAKLSPLELAGARLQVLQSLVEQEVMYQKAEKENTVPTDDEVTAEVNKQKVESRLSAEEFEKQMQQAGLDEKSLRESVARAARFSSTSAIWAGLMSTASTRSTPWASSDSAVQPPDATHTTRRSRCSRTSSRSSRLSSLTCAK